MEVEHSSYTNAHRALLQSFLARGALTFEVARPIMAAISTIHEDREILEGDITESDFNSQISVINSAISAYDLEIRSAFTQLGQRSDYGAADEGRSGADGGRAKVYAIVNTTSDGVAQMATTLSTSELAFVGRILDDMFDRYNHESGREVMAIAHNQALRLNKADSGGRATQRSERASLGGESIAEDQAQTQSATQGLTLKQAEATLSAMVEEGWLERTGSSSNAYYMLAPRALLELKGWLMETYNEPGDAEAPSDEEMEDGGPGRRGIERIKLCAACGEVVISGQRCSDKKCRTRLHDACTGAMWRSQRNSRTCPGCSRPWDGTEFVGVRAAGISLDGRRAASGRGSTSDTFGTNTTGSKTLGRRSSSSRAAADSIDSDGDDDDDNNNNEDDDD